MAVVQKRLQTKINNGKNKGAQLEKIFFFVGVFAFTLIFPLFPFSFAQLEVMASLPFIHIMWATLARKGVDRCRPVVHQQFIGQEDR